MDSAGDVDSAPAGMSDTDLVRAVLRAFGTADDVTAVERVSRAWSNRVWRVRTAQRDYAVKEMLNPWRDPHWRDWLAESISFERKAVAAGVRAPAVVVAPDGEVLVEVGGRWFRMHMWVTGAHPCPRGPVPVSVAVDAARALATMHALAVEPTRRDVFPSPSRATCDQWPRLVSELSDAGSSYAQGARDIAQYVAVVGEWIGRRDADGAKSVMSHGDIDQKNLLLADDGPWLVDWDVAAPWVPAEDALRTALALADWRDRPTVRAFLATYTSASGVDVELNSTLISLDLLLSLDWLDRCLRIASGLQRAEPHRVAEAQQQALSELRSMPVRISIAADLSNWLSSGPTD